MVEGWRRSEKSEEFSGGGVFAVFSVFSVYRE